MPTIVDRGIAWNRKFLFLQPGTASVGARAAAYAVNNQGPVDGLAADVQTEMGTTDLFGFLASAAGALDTGSQYIVGPYMLPYDLDINREIGVGVVYTHDTTGTLTSATWVATYNVVKLGANIYNSAGGSVAAFAFAEPTTALDTAIAVQTNMTANSLESCVSPRGSIKPNTFTTVSGMWSFRARLGAASAVTDKIFFLGILIDYVPRKTKGKGVQLEPGIPQNYLDNLQTPNITAPNVNP